MDECVRREYDENIRMRCSEFPLFWMLFRKYDKTNQPNLLNFVYFFEMGSITTQRKDVIVRKIEHTLVCIALQSSFMAVR